LASTYAPDLRSTELDRGTGITAAGPDHRFGVGLVSLLTVFGVLVEGYHPYAEDGGLYMAGIKRVLDPSLYPHESAFVMEHLRFSLFAPAVAELVRLSHLDVATVLLLLHVASIWLTLYATWRLAGMCYARREVRAGAVSLLAVWLALPVAGTSLVLMDPYVTGRSLSTPCALLALLGALKSALGVTVAERRRGALLCCAALVVAGLFHPLMAAYALGSVLLLRCLLVPNRTLRLWGTVGLCAVAVVVAAVVQFGSPAETPDYLRVVLTRPYWFLKDWAWYELFGLLGPLWILAMVAVKRRSEKDVARNALTRMGVAAACTAVLVAMLFARPDLQTHVVARLQPLRMFQIVYALMLLVTGAALAERLLRRSAWRWIVAFSVLGGVMVYTGHRTFPHSVHLEMPWAQPANKWERAFVWVSRHTPKDALFALDAHYITQPEEDAQSFRAIAERSMLPDYSKDGGEASITPDLSAAWMVGQNAQVGLNIESDADRIAQLKPLGVTWVLLDAASATSMQCDYANSAVKVCRLP
jgi:hypothetical protein